MLLILMIMHVHLFYSIRKLTKNKIKIADDYFLSRLPIITFRLAQGGVRLAATLNRIFG